MPSPLKKSPSLKHLPRNIRRTAEFTLGDTRPGPTYENPKIRYRHSHCRVKSKFSMTHITLLDGVVWYGVSDK